MALGSRCAYRFDTRAKGHPAMMLAAARRPFDRDPVECNKFIPTGDGLTACSARCAARKVDGLEGLQAERRCRQDCRN